MKKLIELLMFLLPIQKAYFLPKNKFTWKNVFSYLCIYLHYVWLPGPCFYFNGSVNHCFHLVVQETIVLDQLSREPFFN